MGEGPEMNRRRFVLDGLAAAGAVAIPGGALAKALEAQPELAKETLALQKDLAVGGKYYGALRDRKALTPDLLSEMAGRMSRVSHELREIHFGRKAREPGVDVYIASQDIPGSITRKLDTGKRSVAEGGRLEKTTNTFNTFFVRSEGEMYEFAPGHSVEGTLEKNELKFTISQQYDLATRLVPKGEDIGPLLGFDKDLTRETLSGWIGVTRGEKAGVKEAFYGSLVPMTPEFFDALFRSKPPAEPLATQIQNGFWKILPTDQIKSDEAGNTLARGYSGSMELAYDPKKRRHTAVGSLMSIVRIPSTYPVLAGHTIGFYTGPEGLKDGMERADAKARAA